MTRAKKSVPCGLCGSLFRTICHASHMLVVGAHLLCEFLLLLLCFFTFAFSSCCTLVPTHLPVCEFVCFLKNPAWFILNSYLVSVLYIGNMAGVCHCEFWNSCGSNSALLGKHTILSVTKRNQWKCVLCKCLGGTGKQLETGSARRCLQCHSRPHSGDLAAVLWTRSSGFVSFFGHCASPWNECALPAIPSMLLS